MPMTMIVKSLTRMPSRGRVVLFAAAVGVGGLGSSGAALALDEGANEKDVLKACERQFCEIAAKKDAAGADLSCTLTKTWSKTKIVEGIEKKKLAWGFGDARCSIDVKAKRAGLVEAVSKPGDQSFEFEPHTIKCQIEREKEVTEIKVTLAPKIAFKDGKAVKAWLGVKDIEAPTVVKNVIWTAAQIENNFGLFHAEMISEINELIGQKCPKVMGAN